MGGIAFKRCRGVVYRATTYDTPLWVSPNTRPGRWSHPEDGTIAQYCSLDVASAMAEMVRGEDLRDIDDARELRVSIWEMKIDEGAIVDYSSADRAAGQGFAWEPLVANAWTACREEGLRIRGAGGRGVLSPSAALPGGLALTLFGPRKEIAWQANPSLSVQVPARHIVHGAPGDDLVRQTRFFDHAYPEPKPAAASRLHSFSLDADRAT